MSLAPLAAVSADAAGLGMAALWRQAQESAGKLADAPAATGPEETAPQPQGPTEATPLPQAQPVRLSSLHLEPTQFGFIPPHRQGEPEAAEDIAGEAPGTSEQASTEEDWRAGLAKRWSQSESPAAQQALRLARAQWALGRRVLLACPARPPQTGHDCLGWGALLLGRAGAGPLQLDGPRWALRLQWRAQLGKAPEAWRWFNARAIKEARPSGAWQLSPSPEPGETRARVALQLGPLFDAERRWQDLGLRLEAARPFREALGTQWSLWLLATLGCWMNEDQGASHGA